MTAVKRASVKEQAHPHKTSTRVKSEQHTREERYTWWGNEGCVDQRMCCWSRSGGWHVDALSIDKQGIDMVRQRGHFEQEKKVRESAAVQAGDCYWRGMSSGKDDHVVVDVDHLKTQCDNACDSHDSKAQWFLCTWSVRCAECKTRELLPFAWFNETLITSICKHVCLSLALSCFACLLSIIMQLWQLVLGTRGSPWVSKSCTIPKRKSTVITSENQEENEQRVCPKRLFGCNISNKLWAICWHLF